MKKRYKVYVFRHGKTEYNAKGIFTGWKDSKLNSEGKKQARTIARKLKKEKFGIAIQTRLSRSKDTLREVLKYHPECKKILTDDRMIERSYGVLEGTSHSEFIKRIGKKLVDLECEGDACENLSIQDRKKFMKLLGEQEYKAVHRGYNVRVKGGESFKDVEKRVGSFIKYLKKLVRKEKTNVAISGHGNSIRIFRKIVERASREKATGWFIPYDKVYEYEF